MVSGKACGVVAILALVSLNAQAADGAKASGVPPVLRSPEPPDDRFVFLPGPAAAKIFTKPPVVKPVSATELTLAPPELPNPGRPVSIAPQYAIYPSDFQTDSGVYCQLLIGHWRESDAIALLGIPAGIRPAYDDNHGVNGRIVAFADPTGRYRQMELDFDSENGALRTVFVYPWKMTWLECRRAWSGNVTTADASQGRKFYSYLNRRLDVLVDAGGRVISIGFY